MKPTEQQLAELAAVLDKTPLGTIGYRLSDEGFGYGWKECETLRQWPTLLDLLHQIDSTMEPRLLLPLLNIPPEARPHFVDLFERLKFRSRSKSTPSYRPSAQQQTLLEACYRVKNRPDGVTQAQAIEEVAESAGISKDILEKAVHGRHSSLRRRGIKARGTPE